MGTPEPDEVLAATRGVLDEGKLLNLVEGQQRELPTTLQWPAGARVDSNGIYLRSEDLMVGTVTNPLPLFLRSRHFKEIPIR